MPVRLRIEQGPHEGLDVPETRRRARAVFKALALGGAELSILLTDDAAVQVLNRDYRHKDKSTDVLAFAMREGELGEVEAGEELLGDVIVSVETARRQAKRVRRDLMSEVTMLLTHGILHLLGWDHETAAKDRVMRAETDRLVSIATGSPFTSRPTPKHATPRKVAKKPRAR